jgi:hypothetical protein
MLADGTWIFLLEGLLALTLAALIVWWTLPGKREQAPPDSAEQATQSGTAEPADSRGDARDREE